MEPVLRRCLLWECDLNRGVSAGRGILLPPVAAPPDPADWADGMVAPWIDRSEHWGMLGADGPGGPRMSVVYCLDAAGGQDAWARVVERWSRWGDQPGAATRAGALPARPTVFPWVVRWLTWAPGVDPGALPGMVAAAEGLLEAELGFRLVPKGEDPGGVQDQ